ncbi:hypothetical protein U6S78_12195 [Cutibacterium acnes]
MKYTGTFTLRNMGDRRIVAHVPDGEHIAVYALNEDGDEVLIDRFVVSVIGYADLDIPTKFICSPGAEVDII